MQEAPGTSVAEVSSDDSPVAYGSYPLAWFPQLPTDD